MCACVYIRTVKCMYCLWQHESSLDKFACVDVFIVGLNSLHWLHGKKTFQRFIHVYGSVSESAACPFRSVQEAMRLLAYGNCRYS